MQIGGMQGGHQIANHVMQQQPQYQVPQYVNDYSAGRIIDPPFKPKIEPVIDLPHLDLKSDPISSLAKAEENYADYLASKPKPKLVLDSFKTMSDSLEEQRIKRVELARNFGHYD